MSNKMLSRYHRVVDFKHKCSRDCEGLLGGEELGVNTTLELIVACDPHTIHVLSRVRPSTQSKGCKTAGHRPMLANNNNMCGCCFGRRRGGHTLQHTLSRCHSVPTNQYYLCAHVYI